MPDDLIRVSLMIRKDQHDSLHDMGVNISGYIRDLIDDRLSDHTIVLSVNKEIKTLYDQIISHAGEGDQEFEPYIKAALKSMLADKIKRMEKLHKSLSGK